MRGISFLLLAVAAQLSLGCQRPDAQLVEKRLDAQRVEKGEPDALRTISVEVIGVYRDADAEFVVENIKQIFGDARDWSYTGAGSGNRVTFEAKSRSAAQAIANQIEFGTQTQVHGHRIRVIFDQTKQVPGPARSASFQVRPPAVDPLGPALDANGGDYAAALKSIGAAAKQKDTQIVELRMPAFKTSDATLALIAKLPSLKKLDLSICRDVTDEGARHLATLSELEDLNLFGTRIGNPGQAQLGKLKKLRHLWLSGLGTEQGLEYLSELTSLETLKVGYGIGYPVSFAGQNGDYIFAVTPSGRLGLGIGNRDAKKFVTDSLFSQQSIEPKRWTHVAASFRRGETMDARGGKLPTRRGLFVYRWRVRALRVRSSTIRI